MKIMNKTVHRLLWTAALAAAVVAGSAQAANNIAAVVGRQVVTEQELQQRLQQVRQQNPGQALPPDVPRQVLEALITERAQLQAALDMGVVVSEQDVDQAQARVAAQNGMSVDQLMTAVAAEGLSVAGYRQRLRDQLMVQGARERILDQRLDITAGEVQAELDRLASQAQGPAGLELAQVLIPVPERASASERAQRRDEAEQVAQQARAGADFAALVRQHGAGSAEAATGSLGVKAESAYPALFVDAVRGLPVGGVSEVVASGAGFHVLIVLQRIPAQATPSLVQTQVRHILRRAETAQQRQQATALLQRVRADVQAGRLSFAAAAQQWGQDGTAPNGGDLGWAQAGQFVPAFEAAMNALRPGVISAPVDTSFGVHLIEVMARREVPMSDAQQREWAREQLRAARGQQVLEAWVREVRAGTYVQIKDPSWQ